LTVQDGEIFVILGRSGTGKTTLLRLIAGLENPDSGSITLGERKVYGNGRVTQPFQRNVRLIFQDLALWPHMTVRQNCEIVIRDMLKDKSLRRKKVEETLERFKISEFANEYPHTLSAGERQRVSLARAVITEPGLLMLDEPLNNLDMHLKRDISGIIHGLNTDMGMTIIYVTHEPDEAALLGARCGILSKGTMAKFENVGDALNVFSSQDKV
jgi:ABC-type sugar transport system ATPase subunit